MLDRIRCQLGLHRWTPWESTNVPLIPIGGRDVLEDISENLCIETLTRTCNSCGKGKIKKVIHW